MFAVGVSKVVKYRMPGDAWMASCRTGYITGDFSAELYGRDPDICTDGSGTSPGIILSLFSICCLPAWVPA